MDDARCVLLGTETPTTWMSRPARSGLWIVAPGRPCPAGPRVDAHAQRVPEDCMSAASTRSHAYRGSWNAADCRIPQSGMRDRQREHLDARWCRCANHQNAVRARQDIASTWRDSMIGDLRASSARGPVARTPLEVAGNCIILTSAQVPVRCAPRGGPGAAISGNVEHRPRPPSLSCQPAWGMAR